MSRMGRGYGSEWHLAEYLCHGRADLDATVTRATGGRLIEWSDSTLDRRTGFPAKEWRGIDFLPADPGLTAAWSDFWPTGRGVQNWDAVGRIQVDGQTEWLLVEAKAHLGELIAPCGARSEQSLSKIREAFRTTQAAMCLDESLDWEGPYYQYANRLAFLHFLTTHSIPARLLFIYFLGDNSRGRLCPQTEEEWAPALQTMRDHLGLKGESNLEGRVHRLFMHVFPTPSV